ncbi:oxysterol-binding protein-related protein 8-like [Protopterus annectens]|uniref:oxysterol-binding protein-related protein 8-like n=1 Tax=Protopterus annectens TaxID=7888 RepID=UPI001CFADC12|nr:oxysterol-binding protein-related protein 8-like [Protopterus annectens]
MVMAAARKKELYEQGSTVPPPNRDSRAMDKFGKHVYASATFMLRALNYLAHFTGLQRDLSKELSDSLVETMLTEDYGKVSPKLATLSSLVSSSMRLISHSAEGTSWAVDSGIAETYREEKKKAKNDFLHSFLDPGVTIMEDWLKIQGVFKTWSKVWCVLKPGMLIIYKNPKKRAWVRTVLLKDCAVIEQPSVKNYFCFKLFNQSEQSIWARKGPKGEIFGTITQPYPRSYIKIQTISKHYESLLTKDYSGLNSSTKEKVSSHNQFHGFSWVSFKHLALQVGLTSSLSEFSFLHGTPPLEDLLKVIHSTSSDNLSQGQIHPTPGASAFGIWYLFFRICDRKNEQKDFKDLSSDKENEHGHEESDDEDIDCNISERQGVPGTGGLGESGEDTPERQEKSCVDPEAGDIVNESTYMEEGDEEIKKNDDANETKTAREDVKTVIWSIAKQIKPGTDLSDIVLPTCLVEPRSCLHAMSDCYYHVDLLSKAVLEENPYHRMKLVVRWYLSGFYLRSQSVRKPYSPALGETFRCMWVHPETKSKTFYIAEQVSRHPDVSAFFVSNRKDGFCLSGSFKVKSKFHPTSLSTVLDGSVKLNFLAHEEVYVFTLPDVHCKGFLSGTLTSEFGGTATITCEKSGYSAKLEFKLKPLLGGSLNQVVGKIKMKKEDLSTVEGHWASLSLKKHPGMKCYHN